MARHKAVELPPSCHACHQLPNETLLQIFGYLEKSDLKQVRLVCQRWTSLPIKFLYDRIFISHQSKDLDVFTKITDSPHLCQWISELVVGTSYFDENVSSPQYVEMLLEELVNVVLQGYGADFSFDFGDQQINDLLTYANELGHNRKFTDRYRQIKRYRIVQRGQSWYRMHRQEQEENIRNGEFTIRLSLGLRALSRLRSMHIENEWGIDRSIDREVGPEYFDPPYHLRRMRPFRMRGSPLARSWHPLCLPPQPFKKDTSTEFHTVMQALALTGKSLADLRVVRHSPSGYSFCTTQLDHRATEVAIAPLRSLKVLYLAISRPCAEPALSSGLSTVLHSLTHLKHLDINMNDGGLHEESSYCSLSDVFKTPVPRYANLTAVALTHIECSSLHLTTFLLAQAKLNSLSIGNLELSSGDWASTFDRFRELSLRDFHIRGLLKEMGGIDAWDVEQTGFPLAKLIEYYVLDGGENPLAAV